MLTCLGGCCSFSTWLNAWEQTVHGPNGLSLCFSAGEAAAPVSDLALSLGIRYGYRRSVGHGFIQPAHCILVK